MEYWRFDPEPCRFPPARLPSMPPLEAGLLLAPDADAPDPAYRRVEAGAAVAARFFVRARYALHEAYALAGVGPEGGLLAPAYHCRTMLDGALQRGAPVDFYPLDEHLRPQLPALRQRLEALRPRPRALLVSHYFGFPQNLEPLRALCDELGLALIEDCSHLGIVSGTDAHLGHLGHWSVASPYKFFGCGEGGQLWGEGQGPGASPPLLAARGRELRALARAWSGARDYRRRALAPLPEARTPENTEATDGCEQRIREDGPSAAFELQELPLRGAPWAARLLGHSQPGRIARRRRAHYQRLLEAVRPLPHCRPLFEQLPEGWVPYMFPLLLARPDPHFFALKQRGLPLGRWDELAVSDCAVSARYRSQLIHLPCHQGLDEGEVDWMCGQLAEVLRAPAGARSPV